eukprot:Skav233001  [mRNA]  locus=scaffold387:375020:379390:- [translate_table: standard]
MGKDWSHDGATPLAEVDVNASYTGTVTNVGQQLGMQIEELTITCLGRRWGGDGHGLVAAVEAPRPKAGPRRVGRGRDRGGPGTTTAAAAAAAAAVGVEDLEISGHFMEIS